MVSIFWIFRGLRKLESGFVYGSLGVFNFDEFKIFLFRLFFS